jgi:hypothetical protein
MSKAKINSSPKGFDFLLNEIRVHWILEQCSSVLRLLQIFESSEHVCIVLEYQA